VTLLPRPRSLRPTAPRHALERLDRRVSDHAIRWIATGIIGVTLLAAGAAAHPSEASSARLTNAAVRHSSELAPQPVRLPATAPVAKATGKASSSAKAVAPKAQRPASRKAPAPKRWLPTGTGMWLHDFPKSEKGNGRQIVKRSKAVGLSTLYVQTGSSKKGWIGGPVLNSLLKETKGTDIKVVAWDFPKLVHPVVDAWRMAKAAHYRCSGCARVAAVAPDIETKAEGTNIGARQVALYYSTLRRLLPRNIAIMATVPWPSEMRVGSYPYAATAPYADAWVPMAYWYNRSPAVVTTTSMRLLRHYKKPIMPVGQGYDGRIDAPYLPVDKNPGKSVDAFLVAAKAYGAKHVSLWSWQTTGGQQWAALARASKLFPTA
jgi:hypothetical protein